MPHKKYEWLEVMRGLAAAWVLVHHSWIKTSAFNGELNSTFVSRGLLGVDFFFILSGFIIAYSSSKLIKRAGGVQEYLSARLLRIYLPYLPIGIGLFCAYALFPNVSAADRDIGFFTSLTLLPSHNLTALSVAWTLKHELLFYTLFSSMILSRTLGLAVMSVWFTFIVASVGAGAEYESPALALIAHPLNLWFFVGMLIFVLPEADFLTRTWLLLLTGFAVLLYFFTVLGFAREYVGMVLSLIVYLVVKTRNIRIRPPRSLIFLGAASYSVYLVHNPIQSLLARVAISLQLELGILSFFAYISIGSLAAGIVYYLIIESKAQTWSKSFINRYKTGISAS